MLKTFFPLMLIGFKQANVVILHKSLADDFEQFCHANDGPLPLLYRSKPGEWTCPSLSNNSDIRYAWTCLGSPNLCLKRILNLVRKK